MPIRFNIHNEDLQFNNMFDVYIYIINDDEDEDDYDEIKNINIKTELYNTIDKTLQIEDCPICYEKFHDNSNVAILCCNHIFHSDCIKKWGEINNICPLCRTPIP